MKICIYVCYASKVFFDFIALNLFFATENKDYIQEGNKVRLVGENNTKSIKHKGLLINLNKLLKNFVL